MKTCILALLGLFLASSAFAAGSAPRLLRGEITRIDPSTRTIHLKASVDGRPLTVRWDHRTNVREGGDPVGKPAANLAAGQTAAFLCRAHAGSQVAREIYLPPAS